MKKAYCQLLRQGDPGELGPWGLQRSTPGVPVFFSFKGGHPQVEFVSGTPYHPASPISTTARLPKQGRGSSPGIRWKVRQNNVSGLRVGGLIFLPL